MSNHFFLKSNILGIDIAINTSFESKILYVEDIQLESATPQLDFGEMPFSYNGVNNKRAESGMEIKVTDNRSAADSQWQLSAQAGGEDLTGSSIAFQNGQLTADKDVTAFPYHLSDFTLTVGDGPQNFLAVNREAGSNVGIIDWSLNYRPGDILLSIPVRTMVSLDIDTPYSAAIEWTLTKGP